MSQQRLTIEKSTDQVLGTHTEIGKEIVSPLPTLKEL